MGNCAGMIKGLTRAGAWCVTGKRSNSTEYAWIMSQACFHGFNHALSGNDDALQQWMFDWNKLNLGPKCKLPKSCTFQFEALIGAIQSVNANAFMPRKSPVPLEHTIYLMLDSAGLSDEDPTSTRACGGWAYSPMWDEIRWFQEAWCQPVLETCHSTIMEAASGLSCLDYAMTHWPAAVYIECYDSGAATDIFRSMSSTSFEMRKIVQERQLLAARFPEARMLVHWQNREDGVRPASHPLPSSPPAPPPRRALACAPRRAQLTHPYARARSLSQTRSPSTSMRWSKRRWQPVSRTSRCALSRNLNRPTASTRRNLLQVGQQKKTRSSTNSSYAFC